MSEVFNWAQLRSDFHLRMSRNRIDALLAVMKATEKLLQSENEQFYDTAAVREAIRQAKLVLAGPR